MNSELVLVVDDSPTALGFTAAVLGNAGYQVVTTSDIWIAHLVQEIRPALILMDVEMGFARSGPALVDALKRMAVTSAIRIYFHSSLPERQLADLVRKHDADGYITKGLDVATFVRKVKEALAPFERERTAAACPRPVSADKAHVHA